MAWNEPGGGKDNDPWGGGRNQGPPDLDEVIRKLQERLGGIFGGGRGRGGQGGKPSGSMITVIIVALLVWLAYDMVYIIEPAERGVVTRFGNYVATLDPGPNVRLPRPIEYVEKVNIDEVRTIEIGYRSIGGQRPSSVPTEALMLTQDENIVDLRVAVQYRVKDAQDYLFNVREPDITVKQVSESALREVVGKSRMDFVLKEGRAQIATRTADLGQQILDRFGTGISVLSVNLVDAQPPDEVQDAFLDAIKAREDQQRIINEAQAYANDILPKARGAAARRVENARAYKEEKVFEAEGEADRFSQILTEFEKAPEVTRERLYLEAIQQVLTSSTKIMVDVEGGNNLFYLPLDRLMEQRMASQKGVRQQEQDTMMLRGQEQSNGNGGDSSQRNRQQTSQSDRVRQRFEEQFQAARNRDRR